ncbi:MAG: hypothetical protein JSS02_32410 [Planctomycetes bacterium]|nr:hypothetical protein [Planctomycetota bacterium]
MRNAGNKQRLPGLYALVAVCSVALSVAGGVVAQACPICGEPTVTLTERLARADVALLAQWVSLQPGQGKKPATTTYDIVQVQRDTLSQFKSGADVTIEHFTQGKPGDLFLLMGQKLETGDVKWETGPALPVTETCFQYIIQAPTPETPAEKRLGYFIKFLEFPDSTIANDAFAQFVNSPTKDIFAVAGQLPREKLRRWLADPKTPGNRRSGYGLMLGLSGNADDAKFLAEVIRATDPDNSIGVEGLTFGYLLLSGEEGLSVIEQERIADEKLADGEVWASALAIRYFWSYGNGKIRPARLQAAMRRLLERPALAEIAITDLARWKDWSLLERLMDLYQGEAKSDKNLKAAIIHYMIACTKDIPKAPESSPDNAAQKAAVPPPKHVATARRNLEELKKRDPELVERGEKFFYLKSSPTQ